MEVWQSIVQMGILHMAWPGSEQQRRLQNQTTAFCVYLMIEKAGFLAKTWRPGHSRPTKPSVLRYLRLKLVTEEIYASSNPSDSRRALVWKQGLWRGVITWDKSRQVGPDETIGVLRRRRPGETPTGRGHVKMDAETRDAGPGVPEPQGLGQPCRGWGRGLGEFALPAQRTSLLIP